MQQLARPLLAQSWQRVPAAQPNYAGIVVSCRHGANGVGWAPVAALTRLRRMERLGEVAAAGHDARIVVQRPTKFILVHGNSFRGGWSAALRQFPCKINADNA